MQDPSVTFDLPPLPDASSVPTPMPPLHAPPQLPPAMTAPPVPGQPNFNQFNPLGVPGMPGMPGMPQLIGDAGVPIAPNPKPGDEKLFTVFYPKSKINGIKSKEAGRPIYEEVDYVRIHIPGDKHTIIDRKVTDEDRSRFFTRYLHYKMTQTNAAQAGMPLAQWTGVSRSQADELKHFNVNTVEQLAGLPDQFGQRFMGFFDLRRKAREYIEGAKDREAAEENVKLKEKLAAQDEAMVKMSERLAALETTKADARDDNASRGGGGRK